MSNLTALQQAMRIVEKHAHNLFNVYNADSRAFLDEMSKCLELERQQIKESYKAGFNYRDTFNWECDAPWETKEDLNHNEQEFERYYNETYKGGEQ